MNVRFHMRMFAFRPTAWPRTAAAAPGAAMRPARQRARHRSLDIILVGFLGTCWSSVRCEWCTVATTLTCMPAVTDTCTTPKYYCTPVSCTYRYRRCGISICICAGYSDSVGCVCVCRLWLTSLQPESTTVRSGSALVKKVIGDYATP